MDNFVEGSDPLPNLSTDLNFPEAISKENPIPSPRFITFVQKITEAASSYFKSTNETSRDNIFPEMKNTIDQVLGELTIVKEKILNHGNSELSKSAEASLDYLVKSLQRFRLTNLDNQTVIHKAELYKRYNECITKAQPWMQLKTVSDQESIMSTVIQNFLNESSECISRDLQVVKDYKQQVIEQVSLVVEDKNLLNDKIERAILPFMEDLKELKRAPEALNFEHMVEWKKGIDVKRATLFETALHIIDDLVVDKVPISKSEEHHEHLVDILSQIAYIEDEIPNLVMDIANNKDKDGFQTQIISTKLATLQEEVHQLNLDLRLSPDLVKRLQTLLQSIDYLHNLVESL